MNAGIYDDISNEDYHSGAGISKSQLDDIAISPAIFQWRKNAPVDEEKLKALDMGTALHCLLLEPDEFDKRFIVAPEFNRRTTAGKQEEKDFMESCDKSGMTIMDAEQGRKLKIMRESALAHPLARWMLEASGKQESSIYWNDPDTGTLCRCRPDKLITDYNWCIDVKSTADMDRFTRTFYDYRYHVQDSFYSDGYRSHFNETPTFAFLSMSTAIDCGRYPVKVFVMDEAAKSAGRSEYKRNLTTYSECLANNEWAGIETLSLPRWAKELRNE
ncbi:PD-(D/E)XK nuclease-like domain-containing protein [Rahnella woolbedingensis]|uniref:Exodeoxyribonuclease VIII n=1 Tax=Rahnella woolbedingensis TaxID=1510574 RepID=A0A419NEV6_9GAMM|nr:PD-(D/E)XK nuclease-like domain-containing protein [Rahnella woolbedingensis]RJT47198.1 exodeoxyribonuclease VIII [Rahnella woolbedingensis]